MYLSQSLVGDIILFPRTIILNLDCLLRSPGSLKKNTDVSRDSDLIGLEYDLATRICETSGDLKCSQS